MNDIHDLSYTDLFPAPFIKHWDLDGDQVYTIQSVKLEWVDARKHEKVVVYFDETTQGLILNKTNCQAIASLYGDRFGQWVGKQIVLYPTQTNFKGSMVDCVRVRSYVPEGGPDGC